MEQIDRSYLLTLGFSSVQISDAEKTLRKLRSISGVEVQLVKAELVAGQDHLHFAARNALQSFVGKRRRSRSLAVEYLLYVSCQRQISRAIKLLGVGPADRQIVLVALSESKEALQELERVAPSIIGGHPDDELVEINSTQKLASIRRAYDVTGREIDAARLPAEPDSDVLKRLIVERCALLDLAD